MLFFTFAAALTLYFHGAVAGPQTFPSNFGTAYARPAVTQAPLASCSNNCSYYDLPVSGLVWSPIPITATYIAETVIVVVNRKTNGTSTTTVSNTDVDFDKIVTPTNLNSDGTVTASVIDKDGSTRIVAYPTTVKYDYQPYISWTGTLSTTVSGVPTCLTPSTWAVAVYPSHPPFPEGVQTSGVNSIEDPRGWTFVPVTGRSEGAIEALFPGFGVWNCDFMTDNRLPAFALRTALYLTKTSTSTEHDDGPTSSKEPLATVRSPVAHTEKTVPVETSTPNLPLAETPSRARTTSRQVGLPTGSAGDALASQKSSSLLAQYTPDVLETSSHALPVVYNPPAPLSLSASPLSLTTPLAYSPAPIIINGETATINAQSQYVIASQTLAPGSSITLGSGTSTTLLALQTSSGPTALIYGPRTSLLPSASGATPAALTIGTKTITPDSHSQYIIAGSTLSAGGSSITLVSGASTTVVALRTSGSETALVYAPSTSFLTPVARPTTPSAITIDSDIITANSETQYEIASQTLTAGGVVTVNGTRISLAAGESDVVVGSSTEALLAPYITAGFGSGPNGTGLQIFTGDADKRAGRGWGRREMWLVWTVGLGAVLQWL